MSETTNISFDYKDTMIHRLNPITKLYALVWFISLIFLSSSPYIAGFLLVLVSITAIIAKSFKNVFKLVLILVVPILVFLSFIHGFLNPGNKTILFAFTLWGIDAEFGKEGLLITYNLVSKLMLILPAVFLFVNTTSQEKLMPNLIRKGVAPSVSYLFLATLNVIPNMKSRMDTIKIAQESRGIAMEGSLMTRLKAFIPIFMPLILSSLTDIQSRGVTLEVRSFGISKSTSSLYNLEESKSDKFFQKFFIVTLVLLIILSILIKLGIL